MTEDSKQTIANGTVFDGKYVIQSKLGEGSMGAVYIARQEPIRRRVAVKVLHPEFVSNDEIRSRFLREARASSQLSHPNTITIFDFGYAGEDLHYIVMEYVEGETFEEVIDREGPLSLARTAPLIVQIAQSLGEAHRKSIVHRDLKPANVLIQNVGSDNERVKVLDFGIAKLTNRNQALTEMGAVFGTPGYIAPEQAKGADVGKEVDHTCDFYALTCCLFEALMGRVPYRGNSPVEIMMKHQTEPIPRLDPEFPDALDAFLRKGMAKDPKDRPQSADDYLAAFLGSFVDKFQDDGETMQSTSHGESYQSYQSDSIAAGEPASIQGNEIEEEAASVPSANGEIPPSSDPFDALEEVEVTPAHESNEFDSVTGDSRGQGEAREEGSRAQQAANTSPRDDQSEQQEEERVRVEADTQTYREDENRARESQEGGVRASSGRPSNAPESRSREGRDRAPEARSRGGDRSSSEAPPRDRNSAEKTNGRRSEVSSEASLSRNQGRASDPREPGGSQQARRTPDQADRNRTDPPRNQSNTSSRQDRGAEPPEPASEVDHEPPQGSVQDTRDTEPDPPPKEVEPAAPSESADGSDGDSRETSREEAPSPSAQDESTSEPEKASEQEEGTTSSSVSRETSTSTDPVSTSSEGSDSDRMNRIAVVLSGFAALMAIVIAVVVLSNQSGDTDPTDSSSSEAVARETSDKKKSTPSPTEGGPTKTLSVESDPPEARIALDGRSVGVTPDEISIPTNRKFSLVLKKDGYEPKRYQGIDSDSYPGGKLFASLERKTLQLQVQSPVSGAELTINGTDFGSLPKNENRTFQINWPDSTLSVILDPPGYESYVKRYPSNSLDDKMRIAPSTSDLVATETAPSPSPSPEAPPETPSSTDSEDAPPGNESGTEAPDSPRPDEGG